VSTVSSTLALSTQGLDKRFGSLVVASDINLVIPHGVRYARSDPMAQARPPSST
jgi:hypothetical protein